MSDLKIFKMYEDAQLPTFASSGSACFDLHAYIHPTAEVIAWTEEHEAAEEYVKEKILAEGCRPGRHYPPTEATIEEMYRIQGKR